MAQFHGHTHLEHFNLFYSADDPTRAISAGFVGGSATAFGGDNPNYRIYYVDGDYDGSSYVCDISAVFLYLMLTN